MTSYLENDNCFVGRSESKCKNCATSEECLSRLKEKPVKCIDNNILRMKEYLNNIAEYSFKYLNSLSDEEIERMALDLDYEDLS